MTAQQLKNSILQMAVQGKLVPQDPNDEPASVLLERIRAEKEALIKAGKIKKEKNPSVIFRGADNIPYEKVGNAEPVPVEVPFEIPESWEWCKVGNIAFVTKLAGFEYTTHIAPNLQPKGVPLVKGKNVQDGKLIYEFEGYISEELSNELERSQINKKCLLTPYVGTIGNIAIFPGNFKAHLGSNVGKIELFNNIYINILEEYVAFFFRSFTGYMELSKHKKATAQESISIEAIRNAYIPIPPLAEQHRIVAKIEELLPYIEKYAQAEKQLNELNSAFPIQLKKSILQLAVQGKLVSQDENDEPASVLLERIREEKKALIKAGKLKKDKNESFIFVRDNVHYENVGGVERCIEDEIPFEIPESWEWVRMESLLQVNPRNHLDDNLECGFIPMSLISDGYNNSHTYEVRVWKEIKSGFTHFQDNDVIFAKITPCFQNRKSAVICGLPNGTGAGTTELHVLRDNTNLLNMTYILYLTKSNQFIVEGVKHFTGTAGQQRIGKEYVANYLVPLPPLAEQHRIVDKIEQLLPLCQTLK